MTSHEFKYMVSCTRHVTFIVNVKRCYTLIDKKLQHFSSDEFQSYYDLFQVK